MEERELQELWQAVRQGVGPDGRRLTAAEREALAEEHLGELLRACDAADTAGLTPASREAGLARLRAAVRSRAGVAPAGDELAARRNGTPPAPDARRSRPRFLLPGLAMAAAAVALVALRGGVLRSNAPREGTTVPGERSGPPVTFIRAPSGARVPEALLDAAGTLHLAYGADDNAYYVRGREDGEGFSTPVRMNRQPGTLVLGGEHGPKLALGRDGALHAVWLARVGTTTGVWYTRSLDGGRTFEPERSMLDTRTTCHSPTVAADQGGGVRIFWLDNRLPSDPSIPMAAQIFTARSTDGGKSFAPNELVRHDHPGPACACCRLEARMGAGGDLYLSFRSAHRNVRDAYLLKGRKDENRFHAMRISEDDWQLDECPGSGIPFTLDPEGRVLASWMSRDRVYWSRSDSRGARFGPRVAVPGAAHKEDYPLVVSNDRGAVLLVWKEGERLRWASYDAAGRFTGRAGAAAAPAGNDKPAAFAGRDGRFHVIL